MVRRISNWRIWLAAASVWLGSARGADPERIKPTMEETFNIAELIKTYPPQIRDRNKLVVYEIAHDGNTVHEGKVIVTRWQAAGLPAELGKASILKISSVAGFFTYDPTAMGVMAWHINFADPDLFAFYGGPLLAQDELQVAEHPVLASVREALVAKKLPALTVERRLPTPVLVEGAPRRVRIRTNPDAKAGRPDGLYGNRFAAATPEVVRRAVERIEPPTVSNIIAMAAPRPGRGKYTREELQYVLLTATTAFRAARERSGKDSVEIHTGFWGCGAFGGNRTVMVALQLAAAQLAGVDALVFHAADAAGEKAFLRGREAYEAAAKGGTTEALLTALEDSGYRWGVSDGN